MRARVAAATALATVLLVQAISSAADQASSSLEEQQLFAPGESGPQHDQIASVAADVRDMSAGLASSMEAVSILSQELKAIREMMAILQEAVEATKALIPCASTNPCQNGGQCIPSDDGSAYGCLCPDTTAGVHCETLLSTTPTPASGTDAEAAREHP
jgi:hypothetical protein